VGNAFVRQYYYIQHQWPELVHRFYEDISKLGRPEDNGTMSITTTMQDINKKILSLNYGENRAKIKSVDAQESYNGGVHVLVTGYLMGKDNMIRNFTQTFFLAPQEKGYFVLNDILRYVEDINHINGEEAFNPLDSWEVSSMEEEEVPVAEVVDESPDDSQIVVESNSKIEEVLKKSYASIVSCH
ncbi:myosin ATPase, partial [Sarracenia purpurea var. burkii]